MKKNVLTKSDDTKIFMSKSWHVVELSIINSTRCTIRFSQSDEVKLSILKSAFFNKKFHSKYDYQKKLCVEIMFFKEHEKCKNCRFYGVNWFKTWFPRYVMFFFEIWFFRITRNWKSDPQKLFLLQNLISWKNFLLKIWQEKKFNQNFQMLWKFCFRICLGERFPIQNLTAGEVSDSKSDFLDFWLKKNEKCEGFTTFFCLIRGAACLFVDFYFVVRLMISLMFFLFALTLHFFKSFRVAKRVSLWGFKFKSCWNATMTTITI